MYASIHACMYIATYMYTCDNVCVLTCMKHYATQYVHVDQSKACPRDQPGCVRSHSKTPVLYITWDIDGQHASWIVPENPGGLLKSLDSSWMFILIIFIVVKLCYS